jgi:hypothetical protein
MTQRGSETNHDWLRLQADTPDFFHAVLNLFFQGQDIGGCAPIELRGTSRDLRARAITPDSLEACSC